jgi:phage FluMu gp28-like protein
MSFSSFFSFGKHSRQVRIAPADTKPSVPAAPDTSGSPCPQPGPIRTEPEPTGAIGTELPVFFARDWFLPTQSKWAYDNSPLKIWQKSRQVGATLTDAFHSVMIVSPANAKFDVWVSSRDDVQSRLYLEDCQSWASILNLAAVDLGLIVLDRRNHLSARVLEFANGRRIYCLSSNPNALAGKRGHVKLDEFALHEDQRLLYRIAKPVTQWGGTLSIMSTHRGANTLFNELWQDILHRGNPMGWSHYTYPIQKAVEEGIVPRINEKSGRNETNEQFLARTRAECIDEEQWLQEYCCQPADESAAFITHEMITACEDPNLRLRTFEQLQELIIQNPRSAFYIGMDAARKVHLCVIDVGEKIGDVMHDRLRIELRAKTYSEMEFELYRLLRLPQVKRACIDSTRHDQLAERAQDIFGWKVEAVHFTGPVKEELAFGLRRDFEDRKLRIVRDDNLRSDLRALRKEFLPGGNLRFEGETSDSHCDRTWAMALRQHAARNRATLTSMLG